MKVRFIFKSKGSKQSVEGTSEIINQGKEKIADISAVLGVGVPG